MASGIYSESNADVMRAASPHCKGPTEDMPQVSNAGRQYRCDDVTASHLRASFLEYYLPPCTQGMQPRTLIAAVEAVHAEGSTAVPKAQLPTLALRSWSTTFPHVRTNVYWSCGKSRTGYKRHNEDASNTYQL